MSRAEDIFQKLIYFGEDAIDEFIINRQSEELFLDFKQAVSVGKNFTTLHRDDRKNLAKAISGFGNSEGGVILWGVECSRDLEVGDVAKAKVKVKNVHRFLSWVENAISGCTIPSHNKVRNHIVSVDKNGDGFLATYIPKSDISPLMTTGNNSIYIRSGSNNVPAPYAVMAGMFGRAPQPNVELLIGERKIEALENKVFCILICWFTLVGKTISETFFIDSYTRTPQLLLLLKDSSMALYRGILRSWKTAYPFS